MPCFPAEYQPMIFFFWELICFCKVHKLKNCCKNHCISKKFRFIISLMNISQKLRLQRNFFHFTLVYAMWDIQILRKFRKFLLSRFVNVLSQFSVDFTFRNNSSSYANITVFSSCILDSTYLRGSCWTGRTSLSSPPPSEIWPTKPLDNYIFFSFSQHTRIPVRAGFSRNFLRNLHRKK